MTPLDFPDKPQYALSFDFDGTLSAPGYPLQLALFDILTNLRNSSDAVWGINTGRSLMQTLEGISESRFPYFPDFIIGREREIYVPRRFGRWVPFGKWNTICEKDHKKLFKKAKRTLKSIRKYVETQSKAEWIEVAGDPAGIIASSEQEMEILVEEIDRVIPDVEELSYQRNSIYLRFGHKKYHKGSAFSALCEGWQVPRERRFAIGDGHNDFGMLNTDFVGMIATLSNAHEDIVSHVKEQGGYHAEEMVSQGVIESLNYFFDERLNT